MGPARHLEVDRRARLSTLRERIEALEAGGSAPRSGEWAALAAPWLTAAGLPTGLPLGATHELLADGLTDPSGRRRCSQAWTPSMALLLDLAQRAVQAREGQACVLWIGRRCWPSVWSLTRCDLLHASLLVEAPRLADRVWACDLALRSSAVAVVVMDASSLDMPASRRLQLSARAGGGMALLARPFTERSAHSAATTRWRIRPEKSPSLNPRWSVLLLRCKGVQPAAPTPSQVVVERDRDQGLVPVDARLLDGPRAAEPRAARQTA